MPSLETPIAPRKEPLGPKVCPNCDGEFTPVRWWQKYCKKQCQVEYWDRAHPRANLTKTEKDPSDNAA